MAMVAMTVTAGTVGASESDGSAPVEPPAWDHSLHTVFAEGFGTGILGSLNYEWRRNMLALRAGVGPGVALPLGASFILGDRHGLELGATYLAVFDTVGVPGAIVGYRYQEDGGIFCRVAFTPMYFTEALTDGRSGLMPWFGVSLGWSLSDG